jgi:hypothetical protein
MRRILLALSLVVLTCSFGYAQEIRVKKTTSRTNRSGTIWAVGHDVANAPATVVPQTVPVVAQPAPVAHSASCAAPDCNGCAPCGKGKVHGKLCKLCDWLCYRPARTCKKGCEYYHFPAVHTFFLGQCQEGACYATTSCQAPTCCKKECCSKCCSKKSCGCKVR